MRTSLRSPSSTSVPQAPEPPDGFPKVFGKYVLVRPMARGGMGELFIAAAGETEGFEKLCVVKKVLNTVGDEAVYRRFLDEAKVVIRLNHANLVQVFDAGRVDSDYYLAMELIEGKDLRAVWNRCAQLHRRIPVDVSIFVIREVLRGLDYVHDAMGLNLVHRDISPPNLLVGYRGEVKLTDFGLAKSSIKRERTSPGVVFGRYSYLSPEQARGLSADRRTDIYACGIVLWELLTGRQLFPSSNRSHQQALAAVRDPDVRPPSSLVPGVPAGLDAVLMQGLARDPRERYGTAGEFRAALSEILARDFPSCDADRVSEFMRDIFAREVRVEGREYTAHAQQDFSDLRSKADKSDAMSLREALGESSASASQSRGEGTIALGDSDIVELDAPRPGWNDQHVSTRTLRESARGWIGRVIAQRYRIDQLLGIGGMGAVFRATHLALGKSFALKVLHAVYTRDSEIITRFMREARAATQTGHPNIIDVVDIGTTDEGDVYFAMELLEGESLAEMVKSHGPLGVRRAVHIARQICRALAAAHHVGIIHRDLKSENVVLINRSKDPDFVKVLDFGICKQVNADSSTTSPGLIMGSPDYMAPEQAAGLAATTSSDIYAVGCILYETLTGRLPFEGRNAVDVLLQKGVQEADPPTRYRPDLPPVLSDVVTRCLRRNPEERPPSMRALEYELTRAVEGRANAVAAVLGLGFGMDTEPSTRITDDPPSGQTGAIASPMAPMLEEPSTRPTMLPPGHPAEVTQPGARGLLGLAAGVKAILFMVLGALLVGVAVLVFSPDSASQIGRDLGLEVEGKAPLDGVAPPPPQQAVIPSATRPDFGSDPIKDRLKRADSNPEDAESVEELVAQADAAAADGRWSEPADQSVVVMLSRLALIDPGNDAIGRLRKQAASELLPAGDKALKDKDWAKAATSFRGVVSIWPDREDAREGLLRALRALGVVHRRDKDYQAALSTADEILNYEPEDLRALLLRAQMLGELDRWEESKDAYAAAKKLKPSSKVARKGYAKAAQKARKQARLRRKKK